MMWVGTYNIIEKVNTKNPKLLHFMKKFRTYWQVEARRSKLDFMICFLKEVFGKNSLTEGR